MIYQGRGLWGEGERRARGGGGECRDRRGRRMKEGSEGDEKEMDRFKDML